MIDGTPGVPVAPDFIQRAGFLLLWAAMLMLPVTMGIVRFMFAPAAWLTLLFLAWGIFGIIIAQVVLVGLAISHGRGFTSSALGYRAVLASLAYYAAWILLAWGLNDWGGASGVLLSPLGERLGPELAGWGDLGLIALVIGTAAATMVFIVLDGNRVKRQAHQAYRSGHAPWQP